MLNSPSVRAIICNDDRVKKCIIIILRSGTHLIEDLVIGYVLVVVVFHIVSHFDQLLEVVVPFTGRRRSIEHAGLDDFLVHVQLVSRTGEDFLLDRVHRHQPQHSHFVLLPDAMRSILSLLILMWIPIGVEQNDRVGLLKVQADTTGARREEKDETIDAVVVEVLQQFASIVGLGRAVQTKIGVATIGEVEFQ